VAADCYRAGGRIKVNAAIFHGDSEAARAGCMMPGAGTTEWFNDLSVGPEMVVVPPGIFTMGSNDCDFCETPPHLVVISAPFAVSATPITRGQFTVFVSETNRDMSGGASGWTGASMEDRWETDAKFSWRSPGFDQSDDHPVVCVNWHDALAYAAWLKRQTGKNYRLLSESEWEYCCRATTETAYSTGCHITSQQANLEGNEQGTTPVRRYPANMWGLFDMHGNICEWCQDDWHISYLGAPDDGSAWRKEDGAHRVVRGGSWCQHPLFLRSSDRAKLRPDIRVGHTGIRVARTV
jgi:formylglycine-generating enzyme required for sulfatase activity